MDDQILNPQGDVTWILVSDSQTAHIYRYGLSDRIIPMNISRRSLSHNKKQVRILDLIFSITENNGATYKSNHERHRITAGKTGGVYNSYAAHDIKNELHRRFAQSVVRKLEAASITKGFDHLIIVAPARIMREIREQLKPELQNRIAGVLPHNLMAYDSRGLLTHLQDTLAEAHLA